MSIFFDLILITKSLSASNNITLKSRPKLKKLSNEATKLIFNSRPKLQKTVRRNNKTNSQKSSENAKKLSAKCRDNIATNECINAKHPFLLIKYLVFYNLWRLFLIYPYLFFKYQIYKTYVLKNIQSFLNIQHIHWTFYFVKPFCRNMGVNLRSLRVCVSQKTLNIPQICTIL